MRGVVPLFDAALRVAVYVCVGSQSPHRPDALPAVRNVYAATGYGTRAAILALVLGIGLDWGENAAGVEHDVCSLGQGTDGVERAEGKVKKHVYGGAVHGYIIRDFLVLVKVALNLWI